MAIIWQQTIHGCTYEVRSAGNSRRLYTDGVFHSQYNAHREFTGGVWDMLMLPALAMPPESCRRALVLGVGGGAVIHMLRRHLAPDEIVGIELDPMHIKIARRFFALDHRSITLVNCEARQWLERYSGPGFDIIIDDLFAEQDGEPVRAVSLDARWFATLNRRLNHDGVLVLNTMPPHGLENSAFYSNRRVAGMFGSALRLTLPKFDNVIAALFKSGLESREFRRRLRQNIDARAAQALAQLDFKVRKWSQ